MKRVIVGIIVAVFVCCVLTCAGDQAAKGLRRSEQPEATSIKVIKMKVIGRIIAVTETKLKVERSVKRTVETFELEIPITKFKVGDKVGVWYIIKDEKKLLKEIRLQQRPHHVQPQEKTVPNIAPHEE